MSLSTNTHQLTTHLAQATSDSGNSLEPISSIIGRFDGLLLQLAFLMTTVAYPLILIGIVLAGYKYITGDAKSGKSGLLAAVVGASIFIFARVIITTVANIASK